MTRPRFFAGPSGNGFAVQEGIRAAVDRIGPRGWSQIGRALGRGLARGFADHEQARREEVLTESERLARKAGELVQGLALLQELSSTPRRAGGELEALRETLAALMLARKREAEGGE